MKQVVAATLAVLLGTTAAAWTQTAPMTATEAMLGRCVAESAVLQERSQKALADAKADAQKLSAYWASYTKPPEMK